MKKTINFYLVAIILPWSLLLWLLIQPPSHNFVIVLLTWALIYRPITDYYRLKSKGLIKPFYMFLIPLWDIQWFMELYTDTPITKK